MGAHIEDIEINISLQTTAVSQQGFGRPLVLGSRDDEHALVDHYGEYADPASMVEDGFLTTDPEYKMAEKLFGQTIRPSVIAVYIRDAEASISAALTSLVQEHSDWYGLLITEHDNTSLHEAGDWTLANKRIFFGGSSNISVLTDRNNIREAYLLHTEPETFPEAAWVGLCLPQDIGSITWKWKKLSGIAASKFTLTELNQIRDGNAQTVTEQSGVIFTNEGITTGGEFIDVIQARDFVEARLREDLLAEFVNNGKISFDDAGFKKIEATLRARFDQCGLQGIIAAAVSEEDMALSDGGKYMYTVTVPTRAELMANDRAARNLTGVKFSFTIAGAIHTITINGIITV